MAAEHSEAKALMRKYVLLAAEQFYAGDSQGMDLIVEVLCLCEDAKNELRSKGYGWTGLDIAKTVALVPHAEHKVA